MAHAVKDERTHTSAVYEQLRADIMNGTLPAASRLKTRLLAERFQVGLSPIREALSRLSTEGWVTQSDRRGFSVGSISAEELWDLHEARCTLNEAGLRSSIELGDQAWEEGVLLAALRLSRLPRPTGSNTCAEVQQWNAAHKAYHQSLICACKSARIVRYCGQLFDEIERYRRVGASHGTGRPTVAEEHREIADATLARDAERAVALLNDHFTKTVVQVERAIRAMKG